MEHVLVWGTRVSNLLFMRLAAEWTVWRGKNRLRDSDNDRTPLQFFHPSHVHHLYTIDKSLPYTLTCPFPTTYKPLYGKTANSQHLQVSKDSSAIYPKKCLLPYTASQTL